MKYTPKPKEENKTIIAPQDIYNALVLLKQVCNTHQNCDECPLRSTIDGCGVSTSPDNYDINKPGEWTAFR